MLVTAWTDVQHCPECHNIGRLSWITTKRDGFLLVRLTISLWDIGGHSGAGADMDDTPYTDDLDLAAIRTSQELVKILNRIRILADSPSLRTLEARTRHSTHPLSKTAVAEMLRGVRFPSKATMASFLHACGVPESAMGPWLRAWERVATEAQTQVAPEIRPATPNTAGLSGDGISRPSLKGTRAQVESGGRIPAPEQTEISKLQGQVRELMADNEQLRLQLDGRTDRPSPHMTAPRDLMANPHAGLQRDAVRYFSIEDEPSELLFYHELEEHIRHAREEIYVLGTGFHSEQKSSIYESLIRAEEEALRRNVNIIRIQTGNPVAAGWAEAYARLLEEFPNSFHMMIDVDGISYNEVVLIDPRSRNPLVAFLFETRERGVVGSVGRPVSALFFMNARVLATNLADQLVSRADYFLKLNSQAVRDLAVKYTYFAWGVHMARSKIQRDVPDAHPLGKAILRGWRRDIRGLLSTHRAAIIQQTGDRQDAFDGVAYELSWSGKARIDRIELRAYEEVAVTIELNGKDRPAFTYVPLPAATEKDHLARGSWIDLVVEGARENKMNSLLAELRDGGAPIDVNRI